MKNMQYHLQSNLKHHLDLSCDKLNDTQAKLKNAQETIRKLEKKMDTRKIVWKINKFSKMMGDAKSGIKKKIDSAPFYTEEYGYKLKVSVYPNGDGPGYNNRLSVYIAVMKGEYDAILVWPMDKAITFTIIDQQEDPEDRENIVLKFTADKHPYFNRPKTEENFGLGKGLISHEKLYTNRYLVDDTLFLQIEVGPR